MYNVRKGLADAGAERAKKIAILEQLMDSQTLIATANTSTLYAYTFTDPFLVTKLITTATGSSVPAPPKQASMAIARPRPLTRVDFNGKRT